MIAARLTSTVFGLTNDILGSSARNLQIGRELFRVDAVEVIEVFVSCADERRLEESREGERGDGERGHGIYLARTRRREIQQGKLNKPASCIRHQGAPGKKTPSELDSCNKLACHLGPLLPPSA